MDEQKVIALIPAWNEAERVAPVVRALEDTLPVLVVDDGSTDQTSAVAAAAGATVVSHAQNRGKGIALTTGFRWALEHEYQAVLTLDADGQHDPREAPKFLRAFATHGDDLIIGRRDFRKMPFPRSTANAIGSWMLSRALGVPILDNQSGYRLHRAALLRALDFGRPGFEFEVDVIIQAVLKGFSIGWVEIETIYNIHKKSYFDPVHDTLRFLKIVGHAYRVRRESSGR